MHLRKGGKTWRLTNVRLLHFPPTRHLILVAGGIGITPIVSLLGEILHQQTLGKLLSVNKIHLIWCVRNNDLITLFADALEVANNVC